MVHRSGRTHCNTCMIFIMSLAVLLLNGLQVGAETDFPEGSFRQVSVFMPDNDPVLLNGQYILLRRGNYHYDIRLPYGYNGRRSRYFPSLFVFQSAIDKPFIDELDAATDSDWIIVKIDADRNVSTAGSMAGFFTAHDDIMNRFRLDPARKIMAGAGEQIRLVASLFETRPGFCGVVFKGYPAMSTGPAFQWQPANTNIFVYSILDGNPQYQSPEAGAFLAGLPYIADQEMDITEDQTQAIKRAVKWMAQRLYPEYGATGK